MTKEQFKAPVKVARLWAHECERVFRDRLVNDHDLAKYDEMQTATLKAWFKEEPLAEVQAQPNLFTAFMDQSGDGAPLFNQARSCAAHLLPPS
jgi:dynein heavy chain, axonemal